MLEIHLAYSSANSRIAEVIGTIIGSQEWARYSRELSGWTFLDARKPFRRFFDVYEGRDGEQWLGVMENVVIEEMLLRGPSFAADRGTIEAIVARMERHPNVRFQR